MISSQPCRLAAFLVLFCASTLVSQEMDSTFARDSSQPIDKLYTDQIHKYTTDPSSIAAIIVEPVQGEGGVRPGSVEYLRGLRAIADEFGQIGRAHV